MKKEIIIKVENIIYFTYKSVSNAYGITASGTTLVERALRNKGLDFEYLTPKEFQESDCECVVMRTNMAQKYMLNGKQVFRNRKEISNYLGISVDRMLKLMGLNLPEYQIEIIYWDGYYRNIDNLVHGVAPWCNHDLVARICDELNLRGYGNTRKSKPVEEKEQDKSNSYSKAKAKRLATYTHEYIRSDGWTALTKPENIKARFKLTDNQLGKVLEIVKSKGACRIGEYVIKERVA